MADLTPLAEGPCGSRFLVAYPAPCGAVDVIAYRYRQRGEAVDLGACAWAGRLRDGAWRSTVGEPGARDLVRAAAWVAERMAAREVR